MAVSMLVALTGTAQTAGREKFAIKATADIGIGNALSTRCALPGMDAKSASSDFGIDFGWTFWSQRENSLEANIGLGYGRTSLKANLSGMEYHYAAPAAADMDNEPYIRYYALDGVHQNIRIGRLTIPIYLNYRYQINDRFSLHALAGMKLGFNVVENFTSRGKAFSYGVYPQYDNLMIDASYMNGFGASTLGRNETITPDVHAVTFSLMAGVGADVRIWESFYAGLTFKYEGAVNNMYKSIKADPDAFNANTAPVTYTVAEGETVKPLSSYLTSSKLSRFSCVISLFYRF